MAVAALVVPPATLFIPNALTPVPVLAPGAA